jgi:hypothetical protein
MGGPLGFAWPTFAAFLVIAASVVVAVVWALASGRRGEGGDD